MSIQPGTYYLVNQGWELSADISVYGPKVTIGAPLIGAKTDKESTTQKFVIAEAPSKKARGVDGTAYTIQPADSTSIYVAAVGPFSGSQLQCTNKAYTWQITAVEDEDEGGSFDDPALYKIVSNDGNIPIPRYWTLVNGQEGEHLVAQVGQTTGQPGQTSWSFVPVEED